MSTQFSPSSSVENDTPVLLTVPGQEKLLVVDPTALDELKAEVSQQVKNLVHGKIEVFKAGETFNGLPEYYSALKGPYYRIVSVTITDNGTIYVVADCRVHAKDQTKICLVAARSTDGMETWERKMIMERDLTAPGNDPEYSRVMDPTVLYCGGDKVFVLAGRWIKGSENWGGGVTKNEWTAAATCVITDANWKSGNFEVNYNFNPETNRPQNLKGFLGGCSNGIKTKSGKYVFPVQYVTSDNGTVKCTIIYSDDLVNWTWGQHSINGSEPALIEKEPDVFWMICRNGTKGRWKITNYGANAFEDIGNANTFPNVPGAGDCEQSMVKCSTDAGQDIILVSNPQNDVGGYNRDRITVYHIDTTAKPQPKVNAVKVINFKTGGKVPGEDIPYGGYSAMAYSKVNNQDGERLLIAYEDQLGISVQDITEILPRLENIQESHKDQGNGLTPEMKELINQGVTSQAGMWPSDFANFIVTNEIPASKTFKVRNGELAVTGELTISGDGFLQGSGVNAERVSLNPILPGLIQVYYPDYGTNGAIRGPINPLIGETVSIGLAFFARTGEVTNDYCPLVRFFNHETESSPSYIMGGLELKRNGEVFVTGHGTSVGKIPFDKVLSLVVEYDSAGATVYVDGEQLGSKVSKAELLTKIKKCTHFCMGAQGAGKTYKLSVGNVSMFNRAMSEYEKVNCKYYNGLKPVDAINTRVGDLEKKVDAINIPTVPSSISSFPGHGIVALFEGTDFNSNHSWLDTFNGIPLVWSHAGALTTTKSGNAVEIYNDGGASNKLNAPSISLADYLAEGSGFTLFFRFKVIDLSTLGNWPPLFALTGKGIDKEVLSMGLTKANSDPNLKLNFHVKKNFTIPADGRDQYYQSDIQTTQALANFNNLIVTCTEGELKVYLNDQLVDTKTVTGGYKSIDKLSLGIVSRFQGLKTKFQVETVGILNRVVTDGERADMMSALKPHWYRKLEAKLARP